MKKTLISMMVGFTLTGTAWADNLTQVYELALSNDPVVNRAKADRDSAFEGISLSRASLLPSISGSIGYSMSTSDQTDFTATDTGLNIAVFESDVDQKSMTLDLGLSLYDHSNWVNLRRAEKVAQQSDSRYGAALQELIVRVVNAYLDVLRAKDQVEFVRAEKRAIERQLEQTKQRFEVGLTARTDVHEAQANFDNTLAQEILAENNVEVALEALRVITGKYHSDLDVLNTERFTATPPQPAQVDDWLNIAQERNLELLVQRLAKDIAKDDIEATRAGHYPTLSLNGRFNRNKRDIDSQGTTTNLPSLDTKTLGITLNVPIYSGGSVTSRTDQARFAYVSASEQMEQTYRQTVQRVRSSYNDIKAAISRIRALEQAVVSAESALAATETGFDVGTRTIVDVLNSTRNLFDARRNLAGARYDFIESVISLKRAAGNLTKQDLERINKGLSPQQS
ncbi:outer membrane channel protein TolC [Alteromonas sediminis]|uniref:Outer membrane channel protein TolC n=1 Tax=Alteromonas sediminis TaxID=2259342 RepID=A0A3N5YLJ5_9ALTE|nr:outer membrane channel protein TolC [Alteromonas sediminis]RPJ66021.1 outer membrane channel protein TolC [Alteromonas sediminis]